MTQRIIFLDIDGPIINTPCYFVDHLASVRRTVMNTQAIGYVMWLCKYGKAKIVTNSTHNLDMPDQHRNLKQDLMKWGVPEDYFHDDWRTGYPHPDKMKMSMESRARRMLAIENWMEKNGEADWIAFDDEIFTRDKRLIPIDFDLGIDDKSFQRAKKLWNISETPIIMG